jgi:hypothetical protein
VHKPTEGYLNKSFIKGFAALQGNWAFESDEKEDTKFT